MKKIFRKIHLWLSVPFGISITLICFAGAMLVFEKEITEMCRPELYYVDKQAETPLPMDSLMRKVTAALPDSVEATGLTVSPDPERTWQVSLSKPRRASVYVDPYTGEIKGRSERLPFFDTMFHLHRWLLGDSQSKDGGMSVGKLLVGISTIVLVLILITGVVIWWPRTKKTLKSRLKVSVTKGWHRFWYDLHVSAGIYATIFLLLMALTGLTWSFSWYRTGFYGLFGIEASADRGGHGGGSHGDSDRKSGQRGGRPEGRPEGAERGGRNRHGGDGEHKGRPEGGRERHEENREERKHGMAATENRKENTQKEETAAPERRQNEERQTTESDNNETAATDESTERHHRHDGEGEYSGRRGRGGEGRRGHRHSQDSTGGYSGRRHYNEEMAATDSTVTERRHHTETAMTAKPTENNRRNESATERTGRNGKRNRDNATAGKGRAEARNKAAARRDTTVTAEPTDSTAMPQKPESSPFAQWQKVYDGLAKANPGFQQITMQDGSAGVIPEGRMSLRAADRYEFNPESGEITGTKPYKEQDKASKARGSVYMLHVGSWGGMLTRILAFLAALIGATLPLTGYYLWIRRLLNRNRKK